MSGASGRVELLVGSDSWEIGKEPFPAKHLEKPPGIPGSAGVTIDLAHLQKAIERTMTDKNVCIAVVRDHEQAFEVVRIFQAGGFAAESISVIGKDHADDKHIHGYVTTGEAMSFWGKQGAVWGGLFGLLAGAGFLFVPGIGPLVVGGPLLSMMVGAVEGGAVLGGIEAVFAGLLHLGLSKDHLVLYEKQLKQGNCLVVLHGTAAEVVRAKDLLANEDLEHVDVHAT